MKNYFNEIEIVKLYKQGKTQQEIATLYNTYNTSIRRVLLRNNIIPRNGKDIANLKRFVTANPFKDGADKDYWLGVLATDGNISDTNSITLALSEKDKELLEKFKDFLGGKVNITTDPKNILRISFKSPLIASYLNALGISPRKSLSLDLKIPITFDMLRGILDGDGSVHNKVNSISFYSSSIKFIFKINNFLTSHSFQTKLKIYTKNRINPFYGISIYGKQQLEGLYNFMYYSEDIPCLNRKKQSIFNKINGIGNTD